MATHSLEPDERTLHGIFSRDLPPVLTVDSGDTVVLRTLDAGWNLEPHAAPGVVARRIERDQPGHALSGPIFVRGAEPGMTLEVRVERLRPAGWGWTRAGGPPTELNRRLGVDGEPSHFALWRLDPDGLVGVDQLGHTVRLRPFMGVLGTAPAEPGEHSTAPPRPCGGNIDCRELVAGSRLFLPVRVPGALFSAGDGHAAQGDGEVSGTAIECPMDVCELTLVLHPELTIAMPRAETPAGSLTFGFDADLNEAMAVALDAMLDLMCQRLDLGRREALALASAVVDLRITQVANGTWGVHALLPAQAISEGPR
ncbi:MAG TPA: acetamidase/formamidase family protein [Candidatus Dormibacteraeota bacterium]|nr:acetamidase/formamidase family protein [Candidatus Dormibacteraeota bacterium]